MTTDTTNQEPGKPESQTEGSLNPQAGEQVTQAFLEEALEGVRKSILKDIDKSIGAVREEMNDQFRDLEQKIERRKSDDEVAKYFWKFSKQGDSPYPSDHQIASLRSTRGEGLLEIDTVDRPPCR